MTEGQQVEKPHGMHESLVLQVLLHLVLERGDVCEDVAVSDCDSLGIGRGAGGEDDLQDVARLNRDLRRWTGGLVNRIRYVFQYKRWNRVRRCCPLSGMFARAHEHFRVDLLRYAAGEVGGCAVIHWNYDNAEKDASEENRNPLGGILT